MANTATRLITLILLLQRQPSQKAADLAEKLGISVRTLHRYFGMLDEMGIPIYAERGPYGGFSLVRGYKLPPLIFTPEEAVAVCLGISLVGEIWGTLYQESVQGALAKLENVLPDEQRNEVAWAHRTMFATSFHRSDPTALTPVLEKLRHAMHELNQVNLIYQSSSNAELSERRVDPYALVHRAGWWYLVGYCHLRQGLRIFRVDRIQRLNTLSQPFQLPEDFEVRAYLLAEFKEQPGIKARLRFVPEAAHFVNSNRTMWESSQENQDGSIEATLSAPDLPWLASIALSFATWVTVLDPPELRQIVREWAHATAALYQDS